MTPRVLPRKHQQLPVRSEPSLCVATPRVSIGPAGSCIKDCEARGQVPSRVLGTKWDHHLQPEFVRSFITLPTANRFSSDSEEARALITETHWQR